MSEGAATAVDRIREAEHRLLNPIACYSTFETGDTASIEILRELDALLKLENYNGLTLQTDPKAHRAARHLIKKASEQFSLIMPEFTPDGDGGLDIEWTLNGRRLVLSCKAHEDDVDFISWRESQGRYDGAEASPELLNDRLGWLLS